MTTSFDPTQAVTLPTAVEASPSITPITTKRITKTIPNQSWSMVQTLLFIQKQEQGLRDPSQIAQVIAQQLAPAINMGDANSDTLSTLYSESNTRRAALDLNPIVETAYKNERNPNYLQSFIVSLLNNGGLETELGTDLTYNSGALPEVEVTDPNVRTSWQTGTTVSPEQTTAQAIAEKLGLTVQHSSDEQINLVIPAELSVDSTDPYTKKVLSA